MAKQVSVEIEVDSSQVDKMIKYFYCQSYSLTIMIPYILDIIIN